MNKKNMPELHIRRSVVLLQMVSDEMIKQQYPTFKRFRGIKAITMKLWWFFRTGKWPDEIGTF